jgi:phenylalanyl-tRNA synthetase beta chain
MKTTWRWLEDYVGSGLSADRVASHLTLSGTEVEEITPVGDDVCFKLEVTSNRTDCLGALGLARELAATTGRRVTLPAARFQESGEAASSLSSVEIEADALKACPYYTGHVLRGLKVGPSPEWLRRRLEAIGLKPINNVVDVTNFVLYETGQPLHAFDLGKLAGRRIVVRLARPGERFDPLVDRKRDKPEPERAYVALDAATLVIADAQNPQAVGGVMGGLHSGVTEQTTEILLESAYFEPDSIRATSRRLELESDSSFRFERGVDPGGVITAARRAVALILECSGGEALSGVLEAGQIAAEEREITVTSAQVQRVLGIGVPLEEAERVLLGLGLAITARAPGALTVRVPSFRRDLREPIDLVEEIGRVHGYNNLPSPMRLSVASAPPSPARLTRRALAEALHGMGFGEAVTDSFVRPGGPAGDWCLYGPGGRLEARNPVNAQLPALRRNLTVSLLPALAGNQRHGVRAPRLYELAHVYLPGERPGAMREPEVLGLLGRDYFDVKGAVESLLDALHCEEVLQLTSLQHPAFQAAAELRLGARLLGALMVPSAAALQEAGAEGPCALAELDVSVLAAAHNRVPKMRELARYPTAERDLAFVLDEAMPWARVEEVARKACDATLRGVELFDEFRGKQLGAGRKSLAFRLSFRRDDRTMTSEEIQARMDAVIAAVSGELGGVLRG